MCIGTFSSVLSPFCFPPHSSPLFLWPLSLLPPLLSLPSHLIFSSAGISRSSTVVIAYAKLITRTRTTSDSHLAWTHISHSHPHWVSRTHSHHALQHENVSQNATHTYFPSRYLMARNTWSYEEAFLFTKSQRDCIWPNILLLEEK